MWEKSVVQSDTGPVTISLLFPSTSSSDWSSSLRMKRSSTVMSALLDQLDRAFRAVGHSQPGFAFLLRRYDAVSEDLAEALIVVTEQIGGQVVATAVPLALPGVDQQLHCAVPVCAGAVCAGVAGTAPAVRPSPRTIRVSKAAHSSSSTACSSGVIRELPIASRRHK